MSTLVVDRLSALSPPALQTRTRGLLAGLADRRLADALRRTPLPDGDWYLRRLDLSFPLDPARPDPSLEEDWAAAVVEALHGALRSPSADVVHYRHHVDALVDLVACLACGDLERAWAWHRAGLLADPDPARLRGATATVLIALRAAPEAVVAVLVRAVQRVGLARVHRLLGSGGWAGAAELATGAAQGSIADGLLPSAPARRPAAVVDGGVPIAVAVPSRNSSGTAAPALAALAARVADALTRSHLAAAFRSGGLRPDLRCASAWAVLALAEVDPAVLKRADRAAVVGAAVDLLAKQRAGRDPGSGDAGAGPAPDAVTFEEEVTAPASWPTVWGGLLFLLATAAEVGVPDRLVGDPQLDDRPLSWCLHAIATRLVPAAADDPAVLVLAGLPVPSESPWGSAGGPRAEESARFDEIAGDWAAATAARLGREPDEDPLDVVREVALRRGEVVWEPGWVDVHLRLGDVDVDVRRAGLDLDPGWVPWLGTVMRFVHD